MRTLRAEIISIGTELLLGHVDTNAAHLGAALAEFGISNTWRQTVGDNLERAALAIKAALDRSDIVLTIAGLGPTEDDLTREAIAAALEEPLIHDLVIEQQLRDLFKQHGYQWTDSQLNQAKRPECAEVIENPNGSAPGLYCEKNGKIVIAIPGPPSEFLPMLEGPVKKILKGFAGEHTIYSRTLKICGLGESVVEEKIKHLLSSTRPTIAPYAKPGEVHLRITVGASSQEEAEKMIKPMEQEVRQILEPSIYGMDQATLEGAIQGLLKSQNATLGFAESCTGGGLGARFTSVAGASEVVIGGLVTYSNESKQKLLSVKAETLQTYGAVSKECALEMAAGAKLYLNSSYAVSITGIAGPGGGTAKKPVGLVYIGVVGPHKSDVKEFRFLGNRDNIRLYAIEYALIELRSMLLEDFLINNLKKTY